MEAPVHVKNGSCCLEVSFNLSYALHPIGLLLLKTQNDPLSVVVNVAVGED
jgi:hypothetical protein